MSDRFDLDKSVAAWRRAYEHSRAIFADDLEELERHVRDHVRALVRRGYTEQEAFRAALREVGDPASVGNEYRKVYWAKIRHRHALLRETWREALMLTNYFKVAWRNLRKHPASSLINLTGLAIGMACCLAVVLFVRDEMSYDDYHAKADRLYRLSINVVRLSEEGDGHPSATTSILWAPAMQRDFPEIEGTARFLRAVEGEAWKVMRGDRSFSEQEILYAEPSTFDLFDWRLVRGDPATALTRPRTIVLTASMADKYFGAEDPLGKTLSIAVPQRDSTGRMVPIVSDVAVTGVVEDVPHNSHFTFDFLVSMVTLNEIYEGDVTTGAGMDGWFWRGRIAHTYLLLKPGADPAALQAKFPDFVRRYVGDETRSRGYDYDLFLQPLRGLYLDGQFVDQMRPVGEYRQIFLFSAVAVFILVIACINFTNLATARSMQRAKEVGLRKVVGAHRRQIVVQFMGESVLLAGAALVLAVGLALAALPWFYGYLGRDYVFDPGGALFLGGALAGLVVLVGVVAGSYPAVFLSRFQAAAVLKGERHGGRQGTFLRKGLVVFQFVLSAFLMIGTLTIYRQLQFMRGQSLGFDQEQVVVLPVQLARPLQAQYEAVRAELSKLPQVVEATISSSVPGAPASGDVYVERGAPAEDGIGVGEYFVEYNFADFFGLERVAGRDFSREIVTDAGVVDPETGELERAVLVNEALVRTFGWASAEDALGRQIVRDPRSSDFIGTVVGVVKDFHYASLHEPIGPFALVLGRGYPGMAAFSIRIRPGDVQAALAGIERVAARFAPGEPFAYSFLDETFRAQYEAEARLAEVFSYISGLAIFIACLGLFGLAAFMAERRTKEIGVRKALGASVGGIVLLLSKEFARLVVVACVLAAPLGYFAADHWLRDFPYRITLLRHPDIFVWTAVLVLFVALATVSYHAARAARSSPVAALRYE